jgi:predicted AAA+ superfamily ATPase
VNVKDEMKFRSFIVSLAARSAQIINYDDIAKDVGVDIKTAQHWMSVVEASGLVKIIHPYFNNAIKRATKTPKLFFMDTGLLCYLVGWKTFESAQNGTMAGSIFETFVVSEIIKSYLKVTDDQLNDDVLVYNRHPKWDSVTHMDMVTELEDRFGVEFDTLDITSFSKYSLGIEILTKLGIDFSV